MSNRDDCLSGKWNTGPGDSNEDGIWPLENDLSGSAKLSRDEDRCSGKKEGDGGGVNSRDGCSSCKLGAVLRGDLEQRSNGSEGGRCTSSLRVGTRTQSIIVWQQKWKVIFIQCRVYSSHCSGITLGLELSALVGDEGNLGRSRWLGSG